MKTDTPMAIRLTDYQPAPYLIDTVDLDIHLAPENTVVTTSLVVRRNPDAQTSKTQVPLKLDGDGLSLDAAWLNGEALDPEAYEVDETRFVLMDPPEEAFVLKTQVTINPSTNLALMGLYLSNGIYTTQCEPEGFRRITYFIDRPDVLSVYTTRIEADRDTVPILLGNGNPQESGPVPGGERHFAVWHDPHPKPSYLFALVAGHLGVVEDSFTTRSGRHVHLAIYVEPGKEGQADYALDALKRSMRWDEDVFDLEYDLDVFNIVAVPHFNMGAMENKGLNVFNDKYVLATAETATDADYEGIESVIAHEYFHNWTGNRITCRDWFQLCLKEGLTVFRDQEFTSDMRSRAVKRIGDVRLLKTHQFGEDAGPLAHPVRPETYMEINNFYTATVYEKGAELVRMIKTIIGEKAFAKGMALYIANNDGTAATVEDFLGAFQQTADVDLSGFMRWYRQSGTPAVEVTRKVDAVSGQLTLTLAQATAPTPDQPEKTTLMIPVKLSLIGKDSGHPVALGKNGETERTIILDEPTATLTFDALAEPVVPSLFRDFSAPIKLKTDLSDSEQLFLAGNDDNPFNRWQVTQDLMLGAVLKAYSRIRSGESIEYDPALIDGVLGGVSDDRFDPAFRAELLALPAHGTVAQTLGEDVDPDAIHLATEGLRRSLAARGRDQLNAIIANAPEAGTYAPTAEQAGWRSLCNGAMALLASGSSDDAIALVQSRLETATNMTDHLAALAVLVRRAPTRAQSALDDFYARYRDEPLVINKWFGIQVSIPDAGALDTAERLLKHPDFSFENPNKVRAVIGMFCAGNPVAFNRPDGAGYMFAATHIGALDKANPQVAARLLTAFRSWRTLEKSRQEKALQALTALSSQARLSTDVADILSRIIGNK